MQKQNITMSFRIPPIAVAIAVSLFFVLSAQSATYTYDANGRLTGANLGDGKYIGYTYDLTGNITALSTQTPHAITAFTIPNQKGSTVINEVVHTITVTMSFGTDVSALVPTITIAGTSISPLSGVANDFTSPQTYTVTAVNATTQGYTVTVIVNNGIIASAGPNGTIDPLGSVDMDFGTDKTFTITPDAGYHIADVLVDSVSQGAVPSYTFANVTANHIISASFAFDAGDYSVSGTIGGDVQQGVMLILSGTGSSTNTSGIDGTFTFAGLSNGSYTITPNLSGYTFSPSRRNITISNKDVTGCDFTAIRNPGIYSITGTVSGGVQQGVTITLSGALSSSTLSASDGFYSFTGLADGSYTVTPELSAYYFSPFLQDVKISGADQTGVDFTAVAISIYGEISKPSFNASHKESVKKIKGVYEQYSTDKFTVQAAIQFSETFNLTTIGENTGFSFNFGLYSFADMLRNATKNKLNGEKGGSATFKITGDDAIKGKTVTVEKVDLRWDKNKKLTVKINGTPASNSGSNVIDLSGKEDSPSITGVIDTFELIFNDAGASFGEKDAIAYTGKKNTRTVIKDKGKITEKTFTLVDWSAKGK